MAHRTLFIQLTTKQRQFKFIDGLVGMPQTIYGMLSKGSIKTVNAVENSDFFANGRLIKVVLIVCFALLAISVLTCPRVRLATGI